MLRKRFSGSSLAMATLAAVASSAVAMLAMAVPTAHGALLLYEPYNYNLAQGASMTGVATNAVGLTGDYTDTNVIDRSVSPLPSSDDVTYNTNSMAFAGLSTQGGSITSNPNGSKPIFSAALSSSVLSGFSSGTVYGSFLVSTAGNNLGTGGNGSGLVQALLFGTATSADNSSVINISPISWGQNYGQIRVGNVGAAGTGTQLVVGTNYLELFQISIGTGGAVNAQCWTLSAAQFANFKGNLTEAALDAASTGTGANQITEEAIASGTDTNYPGDLLGITNMSLFSFGTPGTFDEIRLSNSSLAEAAPTPEPATLGLMGVGAIGLLLIGRKRKMA